MWDGREMSRRLRAALNESDNSAFISQYLSYQYLHEAAVNFVLRTKGLKSTQTITTIKDQVEYTLSADHLNIYTESRGNKFIKYNDGSIDFHPEIEDYQDIIHRSTVASTAIPSRFAVIDHPTVGSLISGTTTSAGATSNGENTLTDSTASFSTTVVVGDIVHNETDVDSSSNGSYGVVIGVTSGTALLTTLFAGGNADWTSGDSYRIIPQGRLQLILDPPPVTAGHTITVYYSARPVPVFSPFRTFRIQSQFIDEIIRDAKALYEFRADNYEKGSTDLQLAQAGALSANLNYSQTFNRKGYGVNMKVRRR